MRLSRLAILAVAPLLLSACARALRHPQAAQFDAHAVFVDRYGYPRRVQPPGDNRRFDPTLHLFEYGQQISRMMDSLEARPNDTVVVIVHGGLNNIRNRPRATAAILTAMHDQSRHLYPIVLNWNSGATSTYLDQSMRVRSGQYVRTSTWQKPLFATLNVGTDLAVGLVEGPRTALNRAFELVHDRKMPNPPGDDVFYAQAAKIEIGRSVPYGWSTFGADLLAGLQLPAKLTTGVIIDAFGTRMWQNMSRRTRLAVRTAEDYCNVFRRDPLTPPNPCIGYISESGAMGMLIDSLAALKSGQRRDSLTVARTGRPNYLRSAPIVLIAHSMGTMIANNLIRMSLTHSRWREPIFDEVVYMAAASSVRDLETSIVPYMIKHDQVQFAMLTLHPANESREVNFWGLIPRGSLLTWIDAGFERTRSFDDRTAGRIANLTSALSIFPDTIRPRVSVKMFSERGQDVPVKHGDFLDPRLAFWTKKFRQVDTLAHRKRQNLVQSK